MWTIKYKYRVFVLFAMIPYASMLAISLEEMKNTCGNAIANLFGEEKVSPSNELKMRQVIHAVNMDDYAIEIRKLNEFGFAHAGRDNALVFPFMKYLFIDEAFFEQLTSQEQCFLVGHELMHIRANHGAKRLGFYIAAVTASFTFEDVVLNDPERAEKIKAVLIPRIGSYGYTIARALWPVNLIVAIILTSYKLSRSQELAADRQIIQMLGKEVLAGGLSLLGRYAENDVESAGQLYFVGLLSAQPTFHERIAQLKQMQSIESLS